MTEKKKEKNFEESLKRLEQIVAGMEGGEMNLEDMIKNFEEGQALIKFCTSKLNEVEKKIEVLVKKGDKVVVEPFEEPESDDSGTSAAQDDELF